MLMQQIQQLTLQPLLVPASLGAHLVAPALSPFCCACGSNCLALKPVPEGLCTPSRPTTTITTTTRRLSGAAAPVPGRNALWSTERCCHAKPAVGFALVPL